MATRYQHRIGVRAEICFDLILNICDPVPSKSPRRLLRLSDMQQTSMVASGSKSCLEELFIPIGPAQTPKWSPALAWTRPPPEVWTALRSTAFSNLSAARTQPRIRRFPFF